MLLIDVVTAPESCIRSGANHPTQDKLAAERCNNNTSVNRSFQAIDDQ
ncbi:hypothetical protein NNX50_10515 [Hafnia paralvei]|nr:hypothetical protein [Hafnia paralvei]MCQ4169770.1 hypothetical protein [Hafnia paralvei]